MSKPNPNRLLVEGDEDKRVIPYFMEHFIPWGKEKTTWPVEIQSFNGIEEILEPGVIEAELKSPGIRALGLVVDSNDHPESRWNRIRQRASKSFPGLDQRLPPEGLIAADPIGVKFGVWLMPDNTTCGMLETFLGLFVGKDGQDLWTFVQSVCQESRKHSAPFKDAHIDKAKIHTWLALQDPPGLQLHQAVLAKTLNPKSPHAEKFVAWFRSLFSL